MFVVFANLTHSQIAQSVIKLRKLTYNPPTLAEVESQRLQNKLRTVETSLQKEPPLSIAIFRSRKQMYVNEVVQSPQYASAVSERCRELTERVDSGASSELCKLSRLKRTFHEDLLFLFRSPQGLER